MKAWTLTEPWASLVVFGEKKWETRSRPNIKIVGVRLAIHAAKGFPKSALELCEQEPFLTSLARHEIDPDTFALGSVIGFVTVRSCLPVEKIRNFLTEKEKAFGDYSDGRYCFELAYPEFIEPMPAKGALCIWNWNPDENYRNYETGLTHPVPFTP